MKYDRIEDFDIQNVRYMTQLNVLTVVKLWYEENNCKKISAYGSRDIL